MRKILAAALVCCMLPACGPSASSVPAGSGGGAAQPTPQPSEPTFALDESVHPYTGLEKEEGYPEGKRGVAVMINNVKTALPQSGINSADLLYEMVTEGGITRLMAVYRNTKEMPVVGPVRSARDQHVQLAIPLNCLYAHIGGSTYALDMLEVFKYPDRVSINGKYKNFYWIDAERRKTLPQESCVYTDGRTFNDAAQRYGLEMEGEPLPAFNFVPYTEEPRELTGGKALEISIRFSGYEDSQLNFDPVEGRYFKYEFGEPQIDTADGSKTYSAENVFLLFADITQYPDRVLAKVNMTNGAGLYFCNGRYERVRWMKGAGEQPLRIVDNEGHETDIPVNPGNSYIAIVGMDQLEYCRVDGMNLEELFTKTGTL
ncbi:MAG: DUF3048 domain-containing protein [Oscillospiraceae bacterium]|nr:DUF3048 domain-containing protein [Oscillospiraceae bacterium]